MKKYIKNAGILILSVSFLSSCALKSATSESNAAKTVTNASQNMSKPKSNTSLSNTANTKITLPAPNKITIATTPVKTIAVNTIPTYTRPGQTVPKKEMKTPVFKQLAKILRDLKAQADAKKGISTVAVNTVPTVTIATTPAATIATVPSGGTANSPSVGGNGNTAAVPSTPPENETSAPQTSAPQEGDTKIEKSYYVYGTAEDAYNRVNPIRIYPAGNYFIYKEDGNGAVNITKQDGTAGGWIYPSDDSLTEGTEGKVKLPSEIVTDLSREFLFQMPEGQVFSVESNPEYFVNNAESLGIEWIDETQHDQYSYQLTGQALNNAMVWVQYINYQPVQTGYVINNREIPVYIQGGLRLGVNTLAEAQSVYKNKYRIFEGPDQYTVELRDLNHNSLSPYKLFLRMDENQVLIGFYSEISEIPQVTPDTTPEPGPQVTSGVNTYPEEYHPEETPQPQPDNQEGNDSDDTTTDGAGEGGE